MKTEWVYEIDLFIVEKQFQNNFWKLKIPILIHSSFILLFKSSIKATNPNNNTYLFICPHHFYLLMHNLPCSRFDVILYFRVISIFTSQVGQRSNATRLGNVSSQNEWFHFILSHLIRWIRWGGWGSKFSNTGINSISIQTGINKFSLSIPCFKAMVQSSRIRTNLSPLLPSAWRSVVRF